MRILVCGGRTFRSEAQVWRMLDKLHAETPFTAIIQGGAGGADRLAKEWARTKPEIERYECRAEWEKYGRSAGPRRNARMLEWKPDVVIAFEGGRGTANMVTQAKAAGVRVIEVESINPPPPPPAG